MEIPLYFRRVARIVQPYFGRILSSTKGISMFLQVQSRQRVESRDLLGRLAEWWPAALIGLMALLNGLPEGGQALFG